MKKSDLTPKGAIHKGKIPDPELRFSFKYFDATDSEVCPNEFDKNYTQTLMERLKALSAWTVKEFITSKCKSLRIHPHKWETTSRPSGFQHLPEHLRAVSSWQFNLTANEYGRVHGFLIGETFYVVWLDCNHRLYP